MGFGGVPCGEYPDITLARSRYLNMVMIGEKTMADNGYQDPNFIYPFAFPESAAAQKLIIMAKHETLNKRLKQFNVLRTPYRHNIFPHIEIAFVPLLI